MDCIFCKIAHGEIPTSPVYENEHLVVIRDIDPKAPHHLLIIPKKHLASVMDLSDPALALAIVRATQHVAKELGIDATGFRLLTNVGEDGGQSVPHLHWHLLGGRKMDWPPG
ncbi:MAG: histidine triad nucleotide-binding protein [Bacteroidota bacterium]